MLLHIIAYYPRQISLNAKNPSQGGNERREKLQTSIDFISLLCAEN